MADNFKEQINQVQKLNQLTQERIDKEKKFTDSTLKGKPDIEDQEFWDWWDSLTDYEKEQEIGR